MDSMPDIPASLLSMLGSEAGQKDWSGNNVPQNLEGLMGAVNNPAGAQHQENAEEIIPVPSFVVKTVDERKRKVFLNFCGSEKVAGWGLDDKEVKATLKDYAKDALDDEQLEALRIPISVGDLLNDVDKKGEVCTVIDCVFNLDIAKQAKVTRNLKVFLIDIVMEFVEQKHKIELDRKYKLPRLKYKGQEVRQQRIRVAKNPIVQDIKEVPEDPCFPLVAKKPKRPLQSPTKEVGAVQKEELKPLQHHLSFEGNPATMVVANVLLPVVDDPAELDVKVDVSGFEVFVSVLGCAPLTINLPFAVTENGGKGSIEDNLLVLRLPHRPISNLLEEMRCAAPHSFGSLDLNSDLYMELEGA
ncbi:hypothetical protein BSKO_04415 [Bryopsis sp. KO-2023]|nr:hypothetical protein BSKO_04415 [Bryopsis sp. KO-2023]